MKNKEVNFLFIIQMAIIGSKTNFSSWHFQCTRANQN